MDIPHDAIARMRMLDSLASTDADCDSVSVSAGVVLEDVPGESSAERAE